MTLIRVRTDNAIAAGAGAGLTLIGLRTCIGIITNGVIRFRRIGTNTRGRVAQAGIMALILRRTHDCIAAVTSSVLASVCLGAGV